ncbi:LOW QUALITY PROTEIN: uncharacterized protein LOC119572333 [Penaeus monodon]|uniref:LOW QUALITY PROTEIN: uncharacterized protein LOC119572333 n=1 Tax=Penaeus monodon TaxID=6687 RepID=UPI0018A78FD4|nr:LOW QUALITY PROTEIN: uncharacterized protein LOC119572333 [Penaeus monodon]
MGLLIYLFVDIHGGPFSSAAVNVFDLPEVNVAVTDKEYIRVTWKREGPWNNTRKFYVDFKADGERPTGNPCTGQLIPCNTDVCTLNSKQRCPPFGLCRDVTVVVRSEGYDSEGISVRTDGYTPTFVNVESNNGTLNVSWIGPENGDGDCYGGSVLTIFTPWTEYSASFSGNHSHYRHTQNLTACDVGKVAASLRSFDLMGNSARVTNSTKYLGENASPVISDLKSTPGRRGVFVKWDLLGKCSRVTSFQLAWMPPDAGGEIIVSDTFANITGLSPCQEYLIRVQPLEGRDEVGGQKSEALFTESEVPQASTNVTVLPVDNMSDRLTVTWIQPPSPGPLCPITSNIISWSRADTGGSAGEVEITDSWTYTITGLDPCAQYNVTVRAVNEEGHGDHSGDSGITGIIVPQASTNVTVLPVDDMPDRLTVTWIQPPSPGPLCPITSNIISWSRADTGGSAGEVEITDSWKHTITGLDPCAQYNVTVRAVNEKGYGNQSGDTGVTGNIAPQAPSSITVLMVENEPNHLGVTWTQPAPPGPLCPIINNSVRWFQSETGETVGQVEIIASTAYFITDLKAYTNYTIYVASKTEGGFSPERSGYNTTDQDIPGPPIICPLDVVSPSSLLVTWERPPQPNGIITGYKIEWRYGNQNYSAYMNNNETYYTITSLTACVFHEITVMAKTIKGFGERSSKNTTMGVAPGAPEQVDAVMVANISDQLWVTWSQPNPYGKCTIINNKVTWVWQNMGENKQNDTTIPKSSNYTITGLKPYTMYTVCVAAQTEGGFGPHGECDNVYTEEDTPGPPEVIDVVQSPNDIYLVWESPDEPNGIILLYNLSWINVAESTDKGSVILPANQTSYRIRGLQSESVYSVLILAKTSAGWGTVSEGKVSTEEKITWPYLLAGVIVVETLLFIFAAFVMRRLRGNTRHGVSQTKADSFQNEAFIPDEGSSDNHKVIQVEDSEENDHDVDHEEITTSESSSEDTGSNSVYRESGDIFQVDDSNSEDKHDTQVDKEQEEVTAVSMSSLEGNILRTNDVSKESGDGTHPIAPKTDTGDGEVKSAHSNCRPLPRAQKENDLSHPSPHDGTEMTEGKEILETKNMENIHRAARDGLADEILKLSENGGDLSAFTSADNNTPLHYAAYEGHTEVVELLLFKRCDPNLSNATGDTPLHLAALTGKIDVVKILSDWEGIDVNNPSATNETLLVYARHGGEKPMLDVLRNPETISPEGNTPLHCASLAGHTEVVRLLLTKNADAKSETPTHHTPLHYAALRGDAILVKLLVYYGADPNAKDERNNTPLHYAALCGHTPVVELLVDGRADTNILTDMGLSVLHKASSCGRLSTVQKLVELQDTLVTKRDKENLSAEDTALIRGYVHTAWWLNKNAPQDSLQDQKHLTSICLSRYKQSGDFYHTYCREKNASAEALATAIDFGVCDMHYQDEQGRTLLHVAAEQNDPLKIRVLLERGALPTARTHDGKTPSDFAREKGHLEAAEHIEDEIDTVKKVCIEELAYRDLINLITSAAQCTFDQDDKEQEARLAAVKKASLLLASGAPLEPPGGHSCYPLHHAITTNCTPLLSLLLAAGAPLTSYSNGLCPVETAWITPDVTTWVGVVVTRAVVHKLRFEKSLLDPDSRLLPHIDTLMELLQGEKPWNAKVSVLGDTSTTLSRLLFRACACGATTLAWWIWHSGGSTVAQNKEGKTPLHGALDNGQLDTAAALALHMGANLFLPDKEGRLPIDSLSDDARSQLLKISVAQHYRLLDEELERAREPSKKEETKQLILLFLALYSSKYSPKATCSTQSWLELYDELSNNDVITRTDIAVCEDEDSETIFGNDFYSNLLESVDEVQSKRPVSSLQLSNSENDMQINTFNKILEKAIIISCEKEFPLFLHLLVHVGGQKVNQELEVCRASPLHYAALKNNASAARYLVSHGASIEAKDRFGNTPAHYACMYGHRDLGDFLRTDQVNRCGLTAMDLLDGYMNYLKLYELDLKSLSNIDMRETNTVSKKIKTHLKELERKWQVYGIGKTINSIHVNYLRGEAKGIETAVFNMVDSVKNAVAKKNPLFSGELLMLGSSADNVRLFCPDEYDCNIVLSNLNVYPNKDLQVSLDKMEQNYSGCTTKIIVSSTNADIRDFLKENCFLDTFYSTVKECVSDYEPEDERMAFIPPGVKRTQVGVALSLVWMGKEYPLLLVDVDIVPTFEAPWPEDLPRPPLTPPHLKSVYINSIGNGEWRFSFAQAENEIMRNLTDDQRQVFLACKMVLSSLKVEKWAPKDIQNRFQYFDKLFFKIPSPKGFILKNTFFLELQDFKDDRFYWKDRLQKRIRSVFKRMHKAGTNEPVKIEAYFAGSTEASCIGSGIAEIVSFFSPKAGFHGVDPY